MADEASTAEVDKRTRSRQVAVLVLVGLGVLFAVVNLDEVSVNWVIATWDTPLIVVIAISILVGAAIGFLVGRRHKPAPRKA